MTTTTDPTAPPLAISRLQIKNFRGLTLYTVNPNGSHFRVSGPNSAGKSTVLDSIPWILGRKTTSDLGEPVHHGAEEAEGYLELGPRGGEVEIILKRKVYADGKTRIWAKAGDGSVLKADVIDTLVGKYMLDPVALVDKLRPQDQVDAFLEVCEVKPPAAQVAEIVGETIEAQPGESAFRFLDRLSGDNVGLYYRMRTEQGRVCEQKLKAKHEVEERLAKLGGPLSEGEQELSLSTISERMEQLHQEQRNRDAAFNLVTQSENEVRISAAAAESLQREATAIIQEIAKLQAKLKIVEDKFGERAKELIGLKEQLQDDKARAEAIPDPAPEIAQLQEQARTIEATNQQLAKRRALWQETLRVAGELDQAQGRHSSIELALERLRELRRHLLDGVRTQFPDLDVIAGELCYQGLPLRACARNEQIWAGALIATGQKPRPRLPILRIDEGERIGAELEKRLQKLCWERQYEFVYSRRIDVKYVPAGDGLFKEQAVEGLETEIVVEG
jgi:DNA repair exonuclease SbcCD ATPase subunit